MASEKVLVEIAAEDNASGKIEDVAKATDDLGNKSQSNFAKATSASKTFALAIAGVGAAVGTGLIVAINAAAGAQEAMARFNAVMATTGKGSQEATAQILKAADAATKLGFDDEDAAESMAKFYQATKSTTEAIKLNQLAMDLARAKHIDLATASGLVGQVLAGNGKVLKAYQIDIKDTASPLEALGLLQEKVKGQADAFTNTLSGQMSVLKITFGNFLEEVGTPFLAGVTSIIKAMLAWVDSMGGVSGILNTISESMAVLQPYLPIIAGAIMGALVPAFIAWGTTLMTVTIPAIVASLVALAPYIAIGAAIAAVAMLIYEAWSNNWLGVRDTVTAVVNELMPVFNQLKDFVTLMIMNIRLAVAALKIAWETNMYGIRDITKAVWEILKLTITTALDVIVGAVKIFVGIITLDWEKVWEGMKQIVTAGAGFITGAWQAMMDGVRTVALNIWEGIKDAFKSGINWIIEKLNAVINSYSSVVGRIPGVGKKMVIPSIPYLAAGGIVTKPTVAMIGEAGPEAVIPLSRGGSKMNGMGNTTIIIEGNHFYGDDDRFVQKIGDKIMDMLTPHISFTT